MTKELKRWVTIAAKKIIETRIFDLYVSQKIHPVTSCKHDFYSINSTSWVNIIPITKDNKVVMVRQFRHGIEDFCLEIPGGLVDSGEENPESSAKRELLEETGYASDEIIQLGYCYPNPAVQNNICYFYLAKNCSEVAAQNLDPAEDIEVLLVPIQEIPQLLKNGSIPHAIVLAAFTRFFLSGHGKEFGVSI